MTPGRAFGILATAGLIGWLGCQAEPPVAVGQVRPETERPTSPGEPPARLRTEVVATHPHDPSFFTQGLVWDDGQVLESIGQYGRSALIRWDLASGDVVRRRDLPDEQFAEGLALVDDRLVQLTWKEEVAHVWRASDFEPLNTFAYRGRGWGLAWDGQRLVMSDGTSTVTFRDPVSFAVERVIDVTLAGRPLEFLNELEWVDGTLWANVWTTDSIVGIDPTDGRVHTVVDASELLPAAARTRDAVLNGIAYRPEAGTFLVTGKHWPTLFEVRFVPD